MSSYFDNLTYLAKNKTKTAILRLIRFYPKKRDSSLEFVFHDVKGERIHASAPDVLVENFGLLINGEGKTYGIKNFLVEADNNIFKTTPKNEQLSFNEETEIKEVYDEDYPRFMFNFMDFGDLADPSCIDSSRLIDVIGRVVFFHSVQKAMSRGVEKRFIDILLEDFRGCQLLCTLWEEYVDVLLEAMKQSTAGEDKVIILQMCRAKSMNDGSVRIANAYDATKMIAKFDVPEIIEFKERYKSHKRSNELPSPYIRSFMSSVCDDLQSGSAPIGTIAEFHDLNEPKMSWIYGTILDVDLRWYFNSCPTCVRKVEPQGANFWCFHCKEEVPFANTRYKLHMFIVDDTGIMQVLCWDKIANELIGKSCEEVLQDMLKHDDGSDLPIELSALKDKALLFKVGKKKDQLKPYNGAFIVSRITADPILVNRFGGLENAQQEFDFAQGELSISYKPKSEVVDDSAKSGSKKKLSDEVTSIDEDSKGKKKIKIEGL